MESGGILVIGCASVDTIHIERSSQDVYHTVGGAGLYTALAAAYVGGRPVTLLAPRPEKLPSSLVFVEEFIDWPGPIFQKNPGSDKDAPMPRLEIVHHGGGRATLLGADWGAESLLRADNPEILTMIARAQPKIVHIAALSSACHQLAFLHLLKKGQAGPSSLANFKELRISAGTYARAITADKASVEELLNGCDYFFMNRNEANLLGFSSAAGKLVAVTDGASGAALYMDGRTDIAASPAEELDPTGAGDTFCGALLAGINSGLTAAEAAPGAAKLAAQVIAYPGCNFYLQN